MAITLAQFLKYVSVKKSGAVNMSLTKQVAKLARLPLDVVRTIQKEYDQLAEKHKRDL